MFFSSKKKDKYYNYKYIFIIFVVVYFLYYFIEREENVENVILKYNLETDGICILYNPEYTLSHTLPHTLPHTLEQDILRELPEGYMFIDYIYKIQNSALSTFHRDVTSSQYIYKTKYPVYTAILYNYSGELLSFCPGSNKTYPFVWSHITNISGKAGTVFLFDCDILHAGCDNNCAVKREVLQYKICHKDDLERLHELSKVNVTKTEINCKSTIWNRIMRKASYFIEMPINTFLYPLMIKRENKNNIIGRIQEYIPISFYNN
jgi:hypothetical protein